MSKTLLLKVSTAMAVVLAASSAAAQTTAPAEDTTVEEIIVSGISRSLASSAAVKRQSDVIVDAVSAEDIGRFPDQNVADSLQRITGIQINRSRGQGTTVSARGLAPDLTRTEYNGYVLATPTGARAFPFTSLTSDFISTLEVYKSPTADMVDGGLSATINARTLRPLDIKKPHLNLIAEGVYEPNAGDLQPHLAVTGATKFLDGRVGVNAGVSYEGRKWFNGVYSAYGLETVVESARNPRLDYNRDGDFNDTFRLNHGQSYWPEAGKDERLTGVLTVEARPVDSLRLTFDALHSEFTQFHTRNENQTRFTNIAPARAGDAYGVRDSVIDANGIISYLDADGVDVRTDALFYDIKDTTSLAALGAQWEHDRWEVNAKGSYSEAERDYHLSTFGVIARGSASYDMRGDYKSPVIAAWTRGFDPMDLSKYNYVSLSNQFRTYKDRNYDLRLDTKYRVSDDGFIRSIQVGAYAANHRNSYWTGTSSLTSEKFAAAVGLPYQAGVESGSVPMASFLKRGTIDHVPGGPSEWVILDRAKFDAALPLDKILSIAPVAAAAANAYVIEEEVTAAYARATFGGFDDRLSGNIGIRYVETSLSSSGAAPDLNNLIVSRGGVQTFVPGATPVTIKNKYKNWLPSLNVRYELTNELVLRFAAARALTRPTLQLLRPALTINANTRVISSGNPNLAPFLANQADLSLEYYFGQAGLISAAVFFKDTENFVLTGQSRETLTLQREEGGTTTAEFVRNAPFNAASAKIKGAELAMQTPLTFLPEMFSGFGVLANVTLIDADKIPLINNGPPQNLSGLSKFSYNLGGYYERGGFGARLSYNYRTKFLIDNGHFADGASHQRAYGQLDASVSYDYNDRWTFTVDANNLTNAKTYVDAASDVLREIYNPGRRFSAGVRAKF